jgi:hypothetical protein
MRELNTKIEELAERKEELDRRRKRKTATAKKASNQARKGVADEETEYEMDVDLVAETEAIQRHVDQLKKFVNDFEGR